MIGTASPIRGPRSAWKVELRVGDAPSASPRSDPRVTTPHAYAHPKCPHGTRSPAVNAVLGDGNEEGSDDGRSARSSAEADHQARAIPTRRRRTAAGAG